MKRIIRFRGKTFDTKKWICGYLIHSDGDVYIFPIDAVDSYDRYEVIPETLGQFTGIKDRNNNWIYEDDILMSKYSTGENIIHKVVFEDGGFRIKSTQVIEQFNDSGRLKQCWVTEFEKEIIGNIHDNPELIK